MSAYRTAVGWVVQTLLADTAVTGVVDERVYEGLAPTEAAYPMVTVQSYTDPADTNYQGSRALTVVDLLVRVWDASPGSQGSNAGRIAPVADAIDTDLHNAGPVTRADGLIAGCQRYAEVHSTDDRSGTFVRAAGGRYRVTVA